MSGADALWAQPPLVTGRNRPMAMMMRKALCICTARPIQMRGALLLRTTSFAQNGGKSTRSCGNSACSCPRTPLSVRIPLSTHRMGATARHQGGMFARRAPSALLFY